MEVLAAGQSELPPIVVHRQTMSVIDGGHRLKAAVLRGRRTIEVRFFDGSETDAFVLSVRLNTAHGLPLSLADRKRAAERIVASHPHWSDRMIASAAGLSAKTVSALRGPRETPETRPLTRIGKDGRVRSVDRTSGRQLAYALIAEDPSLSLRQVARAAGISPETVRDVRNRLSRGEGPLPEGRARRPFRAGRPGRPMVPPSPTITRLGANGSTAESRPPVRPPAVFVARLKADPALRFNQDGRFLLRLLNIHTIRAEDWNDIIASVPPHCREIVAQLARECADFWKDFGTRVELNMPTMT
ncbi:ParB N-terminal domain-containing protein [Actinocorallia longicatena]|uniref:ParB N-terminal domain-containing protein n=1 Tax=Actinocorallia longicatena TaxID=111803 RepID=A0ABP6Q8W2_9ACTN